MRTKPAAVYRLYDEAGSLLYVGMTGSLEQRWTFHALDKFWWHLVVRKDVTWHKVRREAEEAEKLAILTEKPTYNLTLNPGRPPVRVGDRRPNPFLPPLVNALRQRIKAGKYPAGHVLRVDQKSALSAGASLTTFSAALRRLEKEGLVTYRSELGRRRKLVMTYVVAGGES
ncbi:GIY-YIG nuclease family protein [Streptomyces sp. BE133]|uniref:GIY-YIG nuclease family protein n=1 Tax=Streptomyces sp. BE133 TaxID=3002523 RepID=UPI002E777A54|nr:GIY-YIG nuclease family protein [Streptomyces sp. BE133]MEE1812616.1 GIY-YIG nuclease family protein [Streptomyces sp. BE133]